MRIALCLYGVVGSKDSKSGEGASSLDILRLGYEKYKSSLLDHYDVDVYLHTWSKDHKKEILELYNPVKSLFEVQESFDIPDYVQGDHSVQPNRRQSHYSRWRTAQKALALKRKSGIKYDFTFLTRFDWGFEKKINFDELDPTKLYGSRWLGILYDQSGDIFQDGRGLYYQIAEKVGTDGLVKYGRGYPYDGEGIIDSWFIGGETTINIFENLFDKLNEYMIPGNCPQAPFVSNHKLALYHIRENGLLDKFEFITDPIDDHCLLRNKYFNAKI